jgi:hypothetical protein
MAKHADRLQDEGAYTINKTGPAGSLSKARGTPLQKEIFDIFSSKSISFMPCSIHTTKLTAAPVSCDSSRIQNRNHQCMLHPCSCDCASKVTLAVCIY